MSLDIRPHYPVMLNEVLNILQKNKKKLLLIVHLDVADIVKKY